MLYEGSIKSNKTRLLAEKYAELINSGINSSSILVLCQNSAKKKIFKDLALEYIKKHCFGLNIFSFFGLTRYFIEENWPIIENSINDDNALVLPNLGGLEISQYIFKKCIDDVEFKGYNSKHNLLHQMLRRYSLICQNDLSNDEVEKRDAILKEGFSENAKLTINLYRNKTLKLRSFDYLRQIEAFKYLYKNLENKFEYVFIDDGDELTPAAIEYLKYIKPTVKEFYVAYDKKGGSRKGYLCAKNEDFEKLLGENPVKLDEDTNFEDGVFNAILNSEKIENKKIISCDFIQRDLMIEDTVKKINSLIKSGVKPSEISIITPNVDGILKHNLKKINAPVFYLTGSEKLSDNRLINALLTILKYVNGYNFNFTYRVLRKILIDILNIDFETTNIISDLCVKNQDFAEFENEKYLNFLNILKEIKDDILSNQLFILCDTFIELNEKNRSDIIKINELIKQIEDFEEVIGTNVSKDYLLNSLEYTIISENPIRSEDVDDNSIVVGTIQKVIDNEIKTKYQFILDASSENWLKQDTGTLYNSWVFQDSWEKDEYTFEDSQNLILDKTARLIRKLFLLNQDKTYIYSSNYDDKGQENNGGVNKFFKVNESTLKAITPIVPRDDQKPVLEYKDGKMGVNAVAGSGKTTIMLALIMKLLNKGVKPENIFVLTYMDSAAKNFKERIKNNFPNLNELPHISTIHGLALRIIKENENFRRLNLDDDFEIIDEIQTQNIMFEILEEESKRSKAYYKAIENFKTEGNKTFKSPSFRRVYLAYEKYLKENNLLDYNDLLIMALKLLKENKEIREYYQNLAQYILEDEAQDSSGVQQEIIRILSGKYNNVVRVGDVNQSIMSTFSNSDVRGFKEFVTTNNYVNMNRSQRCSKGVYTLANKLIKYARNKNIDAFIDVEMMPVIGKNPTDTREVEIQIFKEENDEKKYVGQEIKKILEKNPDSTIGLLLRTNYEADEWARSLSDLNINTKISSDSLGENPIYKVALSILKFVEDSNNSNAIECSKVLNECGIYNDYFEFKNAVENLDTTILNSKLEDFPLWWDLREFVLDLDDDILGLCMKIGEYYFSNSKHKVNLSIISNIISNVFSKEKDVNLAFLKLEKMKNNKREPKKFYDIKKDNKGVVEIMTVHKSKGDEFDYVFIPKMSKENYPLDEDVKIIKEKDTLFAESVKKYPKTKEDIKKEIVEENFRLLYVGITRAKKRIYLSTSIKYKIFNKLKEVEPCDFLGEVFND